VNKKVCTKCGKSKALDTFSFWPSRNGYSSWCKSCKSTNGVERNRRERIRVLIHYSQDPPCCACCKEKNLEFLSLDHINGGAYAQRTKGKIIVSWWSWARMNGLPSGFRVLCHNCNAALGMYGYCPHQTDHSVLVPEYLRYDEHLPSKSIKLSEEDIQQIRQRHKEGTPQNRLAEEFKVSRALVCLIINGKRRKTSKV